ncbi:MAG: AEC family transporter, partial [Anaerolineaceae bacterium]|nr:AEC family transporter [Anaerolineaceae bacterium]
MLNLLDIFAKNLLPIFIAAGVGALLSWKTEINPKHISKLLFYVFSPSLVFDLIRNYFTDDIQLGSIAIVTAVSMLLVAGFVYLAGRLMKLEKAMIFAMILPAMMINAGNMGMPVNLFVFGEFGHANATVAFIISAMVASTVGVLVASMGKQGIKEAFIGLFRLPMIYGVALGFLLVWTGWKLPMAIDRTVSLFSDASIPTMLVLLGMQLQRANFKENLPAMLFCSGTRLILSPIIVFGLSLLVGLDGLPQQTTILQTAMPSAVTATVLATEFDTNPSFV